MIIMISRKWWTWILRGVLAVLAGVVALIWPNISIQAILILLGIYLIADGLLTAAVSILHRRQAANWWFFLAEGVMGLVIGFFALVFPHIMAVAVVYLVAFWALVTGILEILAAVQLRRQMAGEWLLLLAGILSLIIGIVFIVLPHAGIVLIVWLLAFYLILFGVLMTVLGIRMRSYRKNVYTSDPGYPV